MVPLVSQSWSCDTLMMASEQVKEHCSTLGLEELSEEQMQKELAVSSLGMVRSFYLHATVFFWYFKKVHEYIGIPLSK